jgi:predicted transcriptional regulator of viral defense system
MISDLRSKLSVYIGELLSGGRSVFMRQKAQHALGITQGAFLDAAERLQRRNALISPRRGFYVIVSPQFASWGAPPPSWYIDALMRYETADYYVGLLQAAAFHGASHQAVMEFQVVSAKRFPQIKAGRSRIAFYFRKDFALIAPGLEERKTETGFMKLSSAALTALDLLRYPRASGGIDNVATIIKDLSPQINSKQLAELAQGIEKPVVQRLGYLLDRLGEQKSADKLWSSLSTRGAFGWVEFDRAEAKDPVFTPEVIERNIRWRVMVRRYPEPDS